MEKALQKNKAPARKLTFMLDEKEINQMRTRHVKSPLQKYLDGMGPNCPVQQKTVWQD